MSLRDAERDFKERKDARRAEDLDGLLVVAHLLTSVVSMSVSATRRAVSSCDSIRLRGARCEAGNAAISLNWKFGQLAESPLESTGDMTYREGLRRGLSK